jgi:hypothetical protein
MLQGDRVPAKRHNRVGQFVTLIWFNPGLNTGATGLQHYHRSGKHHRFIHAADL